MKFSDFILFSFPNETDFYLIKNENFGKNKVEISYFNQEKVANFCSDFIEKIAIKSLNLNEKITKLPKYSQKKYLNKEEYLHKIENCVEEINKNSIQKIVFSRNKKVSIDNLDFEKTLLNLREKFPNTLIYLFEKEDEIWIGATPELLGFIENQEFKTIALAGTLPLNESFTEKEIIEQKLVTDFVTNVLNCYSNQVFISELKEHKFSSIKHLLTEFSAKVNPNDFNLICNDLHPTPAICGLPQDKAFEYLTKNEDYSREFYAGKMVFNLNFKKKAFVNLRCLKVFEKAIEIFVGGGITSKSKPENEWNETELKAEMIINQLIKKL